MEAVTFSVVAGIGGVERTKLALKFLAVLVGYVRWLQKLVNYNPSTFFDEFL
jgi:hypothetical protein